MFVNVCINSCVRRFLAVFNSCLPALRRFVLGQARGQQLLAELLEVLQLEPFGPKALLEGLLGVVERALPSMNCEQEVLVLLEAIIAQADGILDDVVGTPLVLLRLDRRSGRRRSLTSLRRSSSLAEIFSESMVYIINKELLKSVPLSASAHYTRHGDR